MTSRTERAWAIAKRVFVEFWLPFLIAALWTFYALGNDNNSQRPSGRVLFSGSRSFYSALRRQFSRVDCSGARVRRRAQANLSETDRNARTLLAQRGAKGTRTNLEVYQEIKLALRQPVMFDEKLRQFEEGERGNFIISGGHGCCSKSTNLSIQARLPTR